MSKRSGGNFFYNLNRILINLKEDLKNKQNSFNVVIFANAEIKDIL